MLLAHLGASGDGKGEPVHEAYDIFVAELLESGYGLLLGEFPVMGRLLAVLCALWLEGSEEIEPPPFSRTVFRELLLH
jgi:hypothetical protein